ncbi:MAG: serine--tRNA ligase [Armatimonadetes bacterium]|nr:serine--tRNA ligase [Armatimonadota bacterium]
MLDIKFIRENAEVVKTAVLNKNEKTDIKKLISLDNRKRTLQFEYDRYRNDQRVLSQKIPKFKAIGKDVTDLLDDLKERAMIVKKTLDKLNQVSLELEKELLTVPNIPHVSVPIGKDESANTFVREWGEKKEFDFAPKDHFELVQQNDLLDFKRAAKLSGHGFAFYTDKGALLERALINFMLDFHIKKHGYKEISAPFIVNRSTMTGTGQLPKLEEDMYLIEQDDLFLIPTAEVSVTNIFADEIVHHKILPQKFVSYSPCFRREAGSYGKDTKGLQRLHQFNKVEMVRFVKPGNSYIAFEKMLVDAEEILQELGLHYRIMTISSGDLSFASTKTYDIEVWAPGAKKYLEVSSVSNFEDFQARRASIRFRDENGKVKFVHTLNGSGLATPRTYIALIENYQNMDGSFSLPVCLKPYIQDIWQEVLFV